MIIKSLINGVVISRVAAVAKISERHYSIGYKVNRVINKFVRTRSLDPPYGHVCQIGDPVLRREAMAIDPETIQTSEFQQVVEHLKKVMVHYSAVGLSASQIGLPWKLFVMYVPKEYVNQVKPHIRALRKLQVEPMRVFINPTLKVTNYTKLLFPEMCASVCGYAAQVRRAQEVEVTALDQQGKPFTFSANGWSARIVQHEFDHLHGKVFTDKMDPATLECCVWRKVNDNQGFVELGFSRS